MNYAEELRHNVSPTLRISDEGHVVVFGDRAALVPLNARDGFMTNMDRQAKTDVGHSTNAHEVLNLLVEKGIKADRVVIFSDMQCWNSGGGNASLAGAIATYRRKINPNLFVHSVDLAGQGKSAMVPDDARTKPPASGPLAPTPYTGRKGS